MSEDLVISGMSGRFPDSDNVDELRDNLLSGKDLVTDDEPRRWPKGLYGLSSRMGKIKDLTRFDADFFCVNPNQAQNLDPKARILLEVTYEAVIDAGYNPDNLRGHNIGVYIGMYNNDYTDAVHSEVVAINSYTTMGTIHNLIATRISYAFDWNGPSYILDSGCSSSLQALYNAYRDLSLGKIEMAIVGGVNMILNPAVSLKFLKYNMMSKVGKCQHLDAAADGFVRSDAVSVILLERRTTAKRIYATVVNINTNNDGYKLEGLSYPSSKAQIALIKRTLDEKNVRPEQVFYIETHGTGTQAGDINEGNAIQEVFCKNRVNPILVGSVKSNLGHTEASSGVCSLIKVLIAIQNNMIPANLHYCEPNPLIPALITDQIVPVVKNTEFLGDSMIAINSFGLGGTNVHLIIKPEPIRRNDPIETNEGIPRLITVFGRTEASVQYLLEFIDNNPDKISTDFISLLDEIQSGTTPQGMNFKGFTLFGQHYDEDSCHEIQECWPQKRPVWLILSGMGCQWKNMVNGLMDLPIFAESIRRSAEYLKPFAIDLIDLLTTDGNHLFDTFYSPCVGVSAVQIALIDLLRALDIQWEGIIGHSAGEMLCAYASGLMNAKQIIIARYYYAKIISEIKSPVCGMGAVGLTWKEAEQRCPPNVYPACHNAEKSVTISGLKSEINEFMAKLKEENVFAKELNSYGNAFHSPFMASLKETMTEALQPIIPRMKRPDKWLSSSHPMDRWHTEEAQYSSAEYYSNNMVVPVLFQQCTSQIPSNAIVIEVAPDSLFRNVVPKTVGENMSYVGLMKSNNEANNLAHLFTSIGRLHNLGLNPKVQNLYQKCELPVRRGTQSLSPLIKWNHSEQWFVPLYPKYFNSSRANNLAQTESNTSLNEQAISREVVPINEKFIKEIDSNKNNYLAKMNQILGIKNGTKVNKERKLCEIGVDSLMIVEIKDLIEEQLGKNISLDDLTHMTYHVLVNLEIDS